MKILAFAEHRDGKFKKSSFETVRAARTVADALHADCCALVIGSGVTALAGARTVRCIACDRCR